VNLQLPPDLPPIGAALATENGTALRGEVHVSSQMVQSIIAAGLQAWQQMQGGGGHGPGGPNAQPGAL
jgi:hypothetical protein